MSGTSGVATRARTVRDLKGVGRDDAAAAEGARGEALGAGLEVGEGGRSAFLERELLLRCERHVEGELRYNCMARWGRIEMRLQKRARRGALWGLRFEHGAFTWGAMMSMFGVTADCERRNAAVSALSLRG